jgi:hypothetical protein
MRSFIASDALFHPAFLLRDGSGVVQLGASG